MTAPGILLVISSLGITALFALGPGKGVLTFFSLLLTMSFVFFFINNVGPIPWLMVAELFLQEARPIAVTIATIVNWLANFVVGLAFPYILVSS